MKYIDHQEYINNIFCTFQISPSVSGSRSDLQEQRRDEGIGPVDVEEAHVVSEL